MVAHQLSLLSALLLLSAACTPRDTSAEYRVRLLVTNVPGDPLAQVSVFLAGKQIGLTGSDGYANLTIVGREGMRANLRVQCPANHRQPTEPVSVGLFDYATEGAPEVSAICEQEHVRQGVVVRTTGAASSPFSLPFSLRGQRAGSTDSAGIGHVLAEGEPGETLDLVFDTSEYPDLQPANPSVRLVLGNHDDAVLAEQRFEIKRSKPAKRGKGRPPKHDRPTPMARNDGPVRIR